jgi:predicted DNA-binding protein YlxM (UPF0122 family)
MADNQQQKESLPEENHQTIEPNLADNQADNDAMLADNILNTELLLPDNVPDSESLLTDSIEIQAEVTADAENNQIDSFLTEPIPDKLSIEELQERYGIKRAALYDRINYLKIKSWREGNKAYLNAEQIAHMDGLYEHMKQKKIMETYPKPEPTGPTNSKEISVLASAVAVEDQDQAQASSAMVVSETSAVREQPQLESKSESEPDVITPTFYKSEFEEARASAHDRVKAKRLAIIQMARTLEENPEMLPPEVQQEIEEAEMAILSKPLSRKPHYDPNLFAQLAMQSK